MRIYMYWPHPHAGPSPLALAMLRPGDELVVQALPSLRGRTFDQVDEYEVVRDLPDPTAPVSGLRRVFRRVELTYRRSSARRRLLERGFDVGVIEMLVYQTDWLDLRRLNRKTPLVSIVHDVRPHRSTLPRGIEHRLLRSLYSPACSGHLVAFSPVLKEELVADFGVAPERVSVIPYWLDASDLRVAGVESPERPLVLFFGTLRANKGLDVLLDALELVGPDAAFDVVIAGEGDGEQTAALEQAARRLPNLRLELGHVTRERKALLYTQASLVVLPYTRFHSFSGVLADAYAYRVPLIVTDVGALGSTVREDSTGWVIEPDDPAALARTLCSAVETIERSDLSARLETAAAKRHFSRVGPLLRQACVTALTRDRRSPST